ncbi:MAG: acyl-CoA dehydrogenase [Actinobacteria bacterium]|nr:acyl-CoA dehydrogenase [Actinomycetota bacterium]
MLTFSDEQNLIRDSVAEIGSRYGHEYFTKKARSGGRSDELWAEVGAAGFIGVSIGEEYGGGGMGMAELSVVIEELGHQGCPLLMLIVSPAICGSVIERHATEAMKQKWLPGIASGEKRMAFAITEPDAGSNSHKIAVTANKDGDVWRLNGTKYYISGVDESDAILVVTRTSRDEETGKGRLSLFVVPTDSPGLSFQSIDMELIAPEDQFTVFFDNVELPADALVGEEGKGLLQVFDGLNPERIAGAAIGNGLGLYALEKATKYANEREVWGVPIATHQGLSHPLAKAYINVQLSRLATFQAAKLWDSGEDASEAANIAKYSAGEAVLEALDQSIQTHGGNGLTREYGLADMWFVARLLRTAPISREMILNFVAQHSLGLAKSY